jgi:antitoxin ParD1/3/4
MCDEQEPNRGNTSPVALRFSANAWEAFVNGIVREGRYGSASEVVRGGLRLYLSERRWFRKDEVHAKIAQGLESLRQGKGLDGETVMAELVAELAVARRAQ